MIDGTAAEKDKDGEHEWLHIAERYGKIDRRDILIPTELYAIQALGLEYSRYQHDTAFDYYGGNFLLPAESIVAKNKVGKELAADNFATKGSQYRKST